MKLKADIDSAVEKITKHTTIPSKPTLATNTEDATNAATAAEDVTCRPSTPTTQTPSSGTGTASTAAAAVAIRSEDVPTAGTEPGLGSVDDDVSSSLDLFESRLSGHGFRQLPLPSARPVLRLRLRRTASKPSPAGSGRFPPDGGQSESSSLRMYALAYLPSSSRTQHRAPTTPQSNAPIHTTAHTLTAHATNGAGPMEVCQPDPPSALPFLMPPSLSGSSTASSSSSSSLLHTPPEGDAPNVGVAGTGPAVPDPARTARGPAPYTSVVEGRDDEAKEAAYALLGLGKAPPKPAAPARRPAPQKAQPAPPSQQPPAAAPPRGEETPLRRIPAIVVSPPKRETPTVESITALLARLTLAPVPAAKPLTKTILNLDDSLLSAAPWACKPRRGTSQEMVADDDDEVARMLGELVDEMCA